MVVAALSYIQYKQWKAVAALLPIISDLLKWRRDLKIADARCRRQNYLSNKDGRRRIYLQQSPTQHSDTCPRRQGYWLSSEGLLLLAILWFLLLRLEESSFLGPR
jgi:hypothetical protein